MGGLNTRVVLILVCAAFIAMGCSKTATNPETGTPEGVHLLADAQMFLNRSEPTKVRVVYLANVANGGTVTCSEYGWKTQAWPDELLLLRDSTWGWGNTSGKPFKPGDKYRPYGEAVFDVSGLSDEQIDHYLTGLKVTVECTNPKLYTNEVVFAVHKKVEPPLLGPKQ